MPKQIFLNLRVRKQQIILSALRDEFMRGSYAQLTVSRVIQEAGISRASFYTYFKDKEDAFSCMLKAMAWEAEEMLAATLRQSRGRFSSGMERLFCFLIKTNVGRLYLELYRHALDDNGCEVALRQAEQDYYREENWKRRGRNCLEALDRTRYPHLNEDRMACAVDIGISILYRAVMMYSNRQTGRKELRKAVRTQLSILEQGIMG